MLLGQNSEKNYSISILFGIKIYIYKIHIFQYKSSNIKDFSQRNEINPIILNCENTKAKVSRL
jgi:hypothetical protein